MAAYTPYALLRVLIERVGWPTEGEKMAALESVQQYENVALFGNLATMLECGHEDTTPDGKCVDCNKQIKARSWRG